jgi:Rrf2 family protein
MMLLTRASEYALLSLDLIIKADKPLGSEQLAKELNLPKSFLAKILQNLAKGDILISHRGSYGGYTLKKKPSEITLYEIINSAEGKKAVVFECLSHKCPNGAVGTCSISPFLARFQFKIDQYLKNLTLEELFNE